MKNWFLKWVIPYAVKLLLEHATKEKIEGFIQDLKNKWVPQLRSKKDAWITDLRIKAKATPGKLDDAGIDVLDNFLDALLPDNPKTL